MITKMFDLLKVSQELRSTRISLGELKDNLERIKDIIIKELNAEALSEDDLQFISLLALEFKAPQNEDKILKISNNRKTVNYDISKSKLLLVISESDGKKALTVAPVFSYQEY